MTKCGATCASCNCVLPEGHESPHLCDCNGSYHGDDRTGRASPGPIFGPWGVMFPQTEGSYVEGELRWNGEEWEYVKEAGLP